MRNFKTLLLLILFLISGCKTNDQVVNSDRGILPIEGVSLGAGLAPVIPKDPGVPVNSLLYNPRFSAISGTMNLKSKENLPTQNLIYINISIDTFKNSKWVHFADVVTNREGFFNVTQKTPYGQYRLKVNDPRYVGEMYLTLDTRPLTSIIFEVELANKIENGD